MYIVMNPPVLEPSLMDANDVIWTFKDLSSNQSTIVMTHASMTLVFSLRFRNSFKLRSLDEQAEKIEKACVDW